MSWPRWVRGLGGSLLRRVAVENELHVVPVGRVVLAVAGGRIDYVAGTAPCRDCLAAGHGAHRADKVRGRIDVHVAGDTRAAHHAGDVPLVARGSLGAHHRRRLGAVGGARTHARAVVLRAVVALLRAALHAIAALRCLANAAGADAALAIGGGSAGLEVGALRAGGAAAVEVGLEVVLLAVGAGGDGAADAVRAHLHLAVVIPLARLAVNARGAVASPTVRVRLGAVLHLVGAGGGRGALSVRSAHVTEAVDVVRTGLARAALGAVRAAAVDVALAAVLLLVAAGGGQSLDHDLDAGLAVLHEHRGGLAIAEALPVFVERNGAHGDLAAVDSGPVAVGDRLSARELVGDGQDAGGPLLVPADIPLETLGLAHKGLETYPHRDRGDNRGGVARTLPTAAREHGAASGKGCQQEARYLLLHVPSPSLCNNG